MSDISRLDTQSEMALDQQVLADHLTDYVMRYDRAHRHIYANQAALDVDL